MLRFISNRFISYHFPAAKSGGGGQSELGLPVRMPGVLAPAPADRREPAHVCFRFCQFPQEIVLQMVERCRVRKLQLLAHQYMVPSKVEFYVSESLPGYFVPYQAERFRRLG